jgi:hypothetical protein
VGLGLKVDLEQVDLEQADEAGVAVTVEEGEEPIFEHVEGMADLRIEDPVEARASPDVTVLVHMKPWCRLPLR